MSDYYVQHNVTLTNIDVRSLNIEGEPYFYVHDILTLFNISSEEFDYSICKTIIRIANVDNDRNAVLVAEDGLDCLLKYIMKTNKCDYYSMKFILSFVIPGAWDEARDAAENHTGRNILGNNIGEHGGQPAKPTIITKQLKKDDTRANKTK